MSEQEPRPQIPEWAARERLSDMAWIAENLHLFWPAARAAYAELGRGAITVDTTDSATGDGHPYWYLTQEQLAALGDADSLRMVATYDPTWELVTMLLKIEERVSTYRIGVPGAQRTAGATLDLV